MALFKYQAFSKDGKQLKGSLDASSRDAAREQLVRMGLFPTEITSAEVGLGRSVWERFQGFFGTSVSQKEKIFFTKQLSLMLKAGVPLLDAVNILSEQSKGSLQKITLELKDALKGGSSFTEALQKYPRIFPPIYIQLVKAGEASGKLEVILDRLTAYLEKQDALRRKVRGALIYPLIQVLVITGVVILLLTFIVPQFTPVFEQMKEALPWSTRIVLGLSDLVKSYYWLIGLVVVGIIIAVYAWKSTARGAYQYDKLKLKIPGIGYFARTNAIVQFSRTLGMLMESGVNLSDSLNIVVNIVDNKVLTQTLEKARENIIKQGKVAPFLKETNLFPPLALYLINTGEQSGSLDTMLLTIAENYENDLNEISDTLTKALEPALIVMMGVIVGFIIYSIIVPIMNMSKMLGV
jgi:type II secretory pathway component PulF